MQSLALDVRVLDKDGEEIELSELIDDDTPTANSLEDVEKAIDDGNRFAEEDEDGDEPLDDEDSDDTYEDEPYGDEEDEFAEEEDFPADDLAPDDEE